MKNNIIDVLEEEYNKDFRGWDFSYLIDSGRMEESFITMELSPDSRKLFFRVRCIIGYGNRRR